MPVSTHKPADDERLGHAATPEHNLGKYSIATVRLMLLGDDHTTLGMLGGLTPRDTTEQPVCGANVDPGLPDPVARFYYHLFEHKYSTIVME